MTEISSILREQHSFFETGKTLSVSFRIAALKRLQKAILTHENDIADALKKDLGKSSSESYMCETGLALSELRYMIRHTRSFARTRRVHTPLSQFYSVSRQIASPYGSVLIMSPWNYPFLLSIGPLIDAMAAGNTAVVKPSAYSPYTASLIRQILTECFPEKYVACITGGRKENTALLNSRFDYIFFTGSQQVGKLVMEKASAHLTPVTLELGGKSPCIVLKNADLPMAARRIIFGKLINCGQTCVAPDYILCDSSIRENLLKELKHQLMLQYGSDPLQNPSYGKIINRKHYDRICRLIDPAKVVFGGRRDKDTLKIEPTILDNITGSDSVMHEEIFGPVLPVLTFDKPEEALTFVNNRPHPLALYVFSKSTEDAMIFMKKCRFGGGCINDTVVHLATHEMGFGGFGESGMGTYHGKAGFDTFSHTKSILQKSAWPDLPMRYQPGADYKDALVHLFLH